MGIRTVLYHYVKHCKCDAYKADISFILYGIIFIDILIFQNKFFECNYTILMSKGFLYFM